MTYEARDPPKLVPGTPSGPGTVKRTTVVDDPNVRGYLKAVDPMTGKSKWETPYKSPNYSSTMVTASDLVFTGVMTGEFQALDAETGKISVELPDFVGHRRAADHLGAGRQAVRDRHERHRRRLCAARRRSQPGQRAGRRHRCGPSACSTSNRDRPRESSAGRQRLPRLLSPAVIDGGAPKTPAQTGRRFPNTMSSTHGTTCDCLASLSLSGSGPRRFAAAAALAVLLFAAAGARACEFPIVKEQIDIVLDRDARLGAEFRAQVKDGSDSVAVIESLVSAEMREKVDVCRFYVAEYLTKRASHRRIDGQDASRVRAADLSSHCSHTGQHRGTEGTGVRATIVALIAGAAGLLSVQAALGQDEKQVEAGRGGLQRLLPDLPRSEFV